MTSDGRTTERGMIKFDVKNRFTGAVQFTAEIDCSDGESTSIKLGLAVKWALQNKFTLAGADLAGANMEGANMAGAYMARANMAGAYMEGANMARANMAGANMAGAYMAGAYMEGASVKRVVAIISRLIDPYEFRAFDTDRGIRIIAGCRNFSPEEYRAHVAAKYPGTPKAAETLAIIDYIEARALSQAKGADQ